MRGDEEDDANDRHHEHGGDRSHDGHGVPFPASLPSTRLVRGLPEAGAGGGGGGWSGAGSRDGAGGGGGGWSGGWGAHRRRALYTLRTLHVLRIRRALRVLRALRKGTRSMRPRRSPVILSDHLRDRRATCAAELRPVLQLVAATTAEHRIPFLIHVTREQLAADTPPASAVSTCLQL